MHAVVEPRPRRAAPAAPPRHLLRRGNLPRKQAWPRGCRAAPRARSTFSMKQWPVCARPPPVQSLSPPFLFSVWHSKSDSRHRPLPPLPSHPLPGAFSHSAGKDGPVCRSAGGGSDPGAAQPTVPSLWCPQSDVLACRASCSAVCSLAAILSHVFQNASPCHLACSAAGPRGRMARCAGMQCSD